MNAGHETLPAKGKGSTPRRTDSVGGRFGTGCLGANTKLDVHKCYYHKYLWPTLSTSPACEIRASRHGLGLPVLPALQ
jgi:hypothetical protein